MASSDYAGKCRTRALILPVKWGRRSGQTHLNSDAIIAGEGHPQGVPLPIVFFSRTRNRPPVAKDLGNLRLPTMICTVLGVLPWDRIGFSRRFALRRVPTRGAPTNWLLSAFCPGKGTHKGCPYRLPSLGVLPWGGHPQGVPLPIVFSRRFSLRRVPTRGAPTDCLLSAFGPGKGTHKGCPYRLSSLGVRPWGGHPQGVPLPIVFSRRFALGRAPTRGAPTRWIRGAHEGARAPTRGAPTRFRQPHEVFSYLMQLPWRRGGAGEGRGIRDGGRRPVRRWRGVLAVGFGGGRCGGCPPAQGGRLRLTAPMGDSPWRRRVFADDSPEPP